MGILRVREAFSFLGDPSGYVYTPGQLVDTDARLWDGRLVVKVAGPGKFETVEAHVSARSGVEQATAEPGEKRTRSRAAKKAEQATAEPEPSEPEEGDES